MKARFQLLMFASLNLLLKTRKNLSAWNLSELKRAKELNYFRTELEFAYGGNELT